jgi:hypothetical protein
MGLSRKHGDLAKLFTGTCICKNVACANAVFIVWIFIKQHRKAAKFYAAKSGKSTHRKKEVNVSLSKISQWSINKGSQMLMKYLIMLSLILLVNWLIR